MTKVTVFYGSNPNLKYIVAYINRPSTLLQPAQNNEIWLEPGKYIFNSLIKNESESEEIFAVTISGVEYLFTMEPRQVDTRSFVFTVT